MYCTLHTIDSICLKCNEVIKYNFYPLEKTNEKNSKCTGVKQLEPRRVYFLYVTYESSKNIIGEYIFTKGQYIFRNYGFPASNITFNL